MRLSVITKLTKQLPMETGFELRSKHLFSIPGLPCEAGGRWTALEDKSRWVFSAIPGAWPSSVRFRLCLWWPASLGRPLQCGQARGVAELSAALHPGSGIECGAAPPCLTEVRLGTDLLPSAQTPQLSAACQSWRRLAKILLKANCFQCIKS